MTNIEVIQELYRTFRDSDYGAFKQICDPNLEWIQNRGFPNGSINYGTDAVIKNVFKAFNHDWSSWCFNIEEYLDADAAVIVIGSYQGTHKISGKSFCSDATHIYDLVDGKVTRFRQFADTKVIWDVF
ncbi:nuclear transport factor 2 family protein [Pleurocapsales cyanobacterium LEGE 10410]|nr:nuclear transport factor 2 family protein [Pleurocapsales cyanobacterium LEGE 10410]